MYDYFTTKDEYRSYIAEARRARAEVFARLFRALARAIVPRRRNAEAVGGGPGAVTMTEPQGDTAGTPAAAEAQALTRAMHELRTPLASVRGFAEILADDPDLPRPQRQRFAAAIAQEADRLSRIIETIGGAAEVGGDRWCVRDEAFAEALARLKAEAAETEEGVDPARDPVAA